MSTQDELNYLVPLQFYVAQTLELIQFTNTHYLETLCFPDFSYVLCLVFTNFILLHIHSLVSSFKIHQQMYSHFNMQQFYYAFSFQNMLSNVIVCLFSTASQRFCYLCIKVSLCPLVSLPFRVFKYIHNIFFLLFSKCTIQLCIPQNHNTSERII